MPDIMTLIEIAPWREAVTYRDTWPHEYVVAGRDRQEALLAAFCARIAQGEGVECRFFGQTRRHLFLGDHKYWTMTDCAEIDLASDDYVLNRARPLPRPPRLRRAGWRPRCEGRVESR